MSKPQVLIDASVLRLYMEGTDDDRKVLDKLYGEALSPLRDLEQKVLFKIFRDHLEKKNVVYPVTVQGGRTINFRIISDEQNRMDPPARY